MIRHMLDCSSGHPRACRRGVPSVRGIIAGRDAGRVARRSGDAEDMLAAMHAAGLVVAVACTVGVTLVAPARH